MADKKITQLTDGGAPQATDEFVIARAGDNYKLDYASLDAGLAGAVILAPAASTRNVIVPTAGTVIGLIIKANAAQDFDLMQWQDPSGGVLASMSSIQTTSTIFTLNDTLGTGNLLIEGLRLGNDCFYVNSDGQVQVIGQVSNAIQLILQPLNPGHATDIMRLQVGATFPFRLDKNGRPVIAVHSAPSAGTANAGLIAAGDLAQWFDQTNGAAKWMGWGRTADGTTVTWEIPNGVVYVAGGTDVALADGGTGASLVDPNADRMFFWDDSAGSTAFLTPGTGLTITGTQMDVTSSGSGITTSQIPLASDSFTRADGVLGGDWTATQNSGFVIATNKAQPTGYASDRMSIFSAVPTFPTDQYAQAAVSGLSATGAQTGIGVAVRGSLSAITAYVAWVSGAASSNVTVGKWIAGAFTSLGTRTQAFSDGDIVKLEVTGTTLKVYRNGVQLGANITDSAITSGYPGMSYSSVGAGALDDFAGGILASDVQTALNALGGEFSDRELAALARLTSAADKLPYFTGDGTAATADLTSFARTVLDDTTAAAARATLGAAPVAATYITQTADSELSAEQALGSLATGILKSTTTTGVLSIAAQGTDYYAPGGTDVAVADGGTGASTAATARTNLGVSPSTSGWPYGGTGYKTQHYYSCDLPGNANATTVQTEALATAVPFPCRSTTTFDQIVVFTTVQGTTTAVMRLGIYNDNGSAYPGTLLLDAGTVATVSGGSVAKTISISQQLTGGTLYWLVAAVQGTGGVRPTVIIPNSNVLTPTWLSLPTVQINGAGYSQASVTGAFGSPYTTTVTMITSPTWMWLRAA